MKLLLFDIDGTLIRSNSAGRLAMQAALEELFGAAGPLENYNMSGKTDARIVTDLLTAVGVPQNKIAAQLDAVFECMAVKADEIYPTKGIEKCAGVEELLAVLDPNEGCVLGLLTGNAQPTAALKLEAAGILPAQFLVGAYGSESLDRNDLPAIAMKRAETLTGKPFTGDNTVIIGDTPADILCARAGRATAVAVASGWHAAATLLNYNPDFLFENMLDTQGILAALL